MTREEFVRSVKHQAKDAAVATTIGRLSHPPGRRPSSQDLQLSAWYNALSDSDREQLHSIVSEAAESAVFGVLAILDGVRPIEGPGVKGELELVYRKGEERLLITDPNQEMLHDIYGDV